MIMKTIVLLTLLAASASAFDKKQLMKGKYTYEKHPEQQMVDITDDGNQFHPISRRVLRWERSADSFPVESNAASDIAFSDFPLPEDLQVMPSDIDFAKIRPLLPPKTKPSLVNNDVDYQPDLEF